MPVRVGINGFGRIGRNIMRAALGDTNIEFVAVNDLTSAATLAHLLKYDSVLGNLQARVSSTQDSIAVEGDSFKADKPRLWSDQTILPHMWCPRYFDLQPTSLIVGESHATMADLLAKNTVFSAEVAPRGKARR